MFEVAWGTLVLLGLATRLAALPLFAIISVAIYSRKVPLLFESGF